MDNFTSPRVSVLITAYNLEGYIARAIQSVLTQTEVNLEIIVVDDASTDRTREVIASFTDPRIVSINRKTNGGPSEARNEGIAKATGAWIAILDGDDFLKPERLRNCLLRAHQLSADIIVDNLDVYDEATGGHHLMFDDETLGRSDVLKLAAFIRGNASILGGFSLGYLKPILSHNFLSQHSIKYQTDVKIGEDYILLTECLANGAKCCVERTAGYVYTRRRNSISHRLSVDDIEAMIRCDKELVSRFDFDNLSKEAHARRTVFLNRGLAYARLVNAIKKKDFTAIIKTIASRPSAVFYLYKPIVARLKRFKWL